MAELIGEAIRTDFRIVFLLDFLVDYRQRSESIIVLQQTEVPFFSKCNANNLVFFINFWLQFPLNYKNRQKHKPCWIKGKRMKSIFTHSRDTHRKVFKTREVRSGPLKTCREKHRTKVTFFSSPDCVAFELNGSKTMYCFCFFP